MALPRDSAESDIPYLPINADARRIANAWDPDKDIADGKQCRAYGAVGVMQRPGRLHVTWENDRTLRIDADAGTQTRLLHFGPAPAQKGERSWQGYSTAQWVVAGSLLLLVYGRAIRIMLSGLTISGPARAAELTTDAGYDSQRVLAVCVQTGVLRHPLRGRISLPAPFALCAGAGPKCSRRVCVPASASMRRVRSFSHVTCRRPGRCITPTAP